MMWPHPQAFLHHKKTKVVCTKCLKTFDYGHRPGSKNTFCSRLCRMRWWQQNNREHIKKYAKKRRRSKPIYCRVCKNVIPNEARGSGVTLCSDECRRIKISENNTRFRKKRKEEVFRMLGGAVCVYCGCDHVPALEINHRNGGGSQEMRSGAGSRLVSDIFYGRRGMSDLEIVCRVCNAWHYITRKTGVDNWSIKWNK